MREVVIFSDLDGSLLDHHDYSHAAADEMLDRLAMRKIPVVLASSKTRAEMLCIRAELGNCAPFIFENGAAVMIPEGFFREIPDGCYAENGYWLKTFARQRRHWLDQLRILATRFDGEFIGFDQIGVEGIMELTGLEPDAAHRASLREFGEPIRWFGSESRRKEFIEALEADGAKVLQGGRFLHVSDLCDKGVALSWLVQQFSRENDGKKITSIALGDSQNDVAMLEAADHAVIILSPVNEPPQLSPTVDSILTTRYGPAGWAEGVRAVLEKLERH